MLLTVLQELPTNDLSWRNTFADDFPAYTPDRGPEGCPGCDIRTLNGTPLRVTPRYALVCGSVWMPDRDAPVDVPFWFSVVARGVYAGHYSEPDDWQKLVRDVAKWLATNGYGEVDVILTNLTKRGGRSLPHTHSQLLIRLPSLDEGTVAQGVGFATLWMRIASMAGKVLHCRADMLD